MQTLPRMDKVVIKDYYHKTIVNENTQRMKLVNLLPIYAPNLRGPFVDLALLQTLKISF